MDRKSQILTALEGFIRQRPGLEFGNYGDRKAYFSEMRRITRQRHDAERLLRAVALSSMPAEVLVGGFRAFSGRLTLTDCERNGKHALRLEYCTGQYFPTEYRAAVCAVCAAALWDWYRDDYVKAAKPGESPGDAIRRQFRREFGARFASRWFDSREPPSAHRGRLSIGGRCAGGCRRAAVAVYY